MGATRQTVLRGVGFATLLLLFVGLAFGWGQHVLAETAAPAVEPRTYIPLMNAAPPPPEIRMVPFAKGFDTDTITDIAHAGDSRLFVVRRGGVIFLVYPDGVVDSTPVLDIRSMVSVENWEEGLLGLAFHPDYPQEPYMYVVYTTGTHWRLSRFTVTEKSEVTAADELVMIDFDKPPGLGGRPSPVHNGGDVTFGPDGYLYVPIGDGGPDPYEVFGPGDPYNNSQRPTNLYGSILRLDVDRTNGIAAECGDGGYSIPKDNPYVNTIGCDEVWATGLRNPWRIAFDPVTGELYVTDVGEWEREEVNITTIEEGNGLNFGWHCYEGTFDYATIWPQIASGCGPASDYHFPFYQYNHSKGECSITGGPVYRGRQFPQIYGRYILIDLCLKEFKLLHRDGNGDWQANDAGKTQFSISTFGEDINGELYVGLWSNKGDARVYKLIVK